MVETYLKLGCFSKICRNSSWYNYFLISIPVTAKRVIFTTGVSLDETDLVFNWVHFLIVMCKFSLGASYFCKVCSFTKANTNLVVSLYLTKRRTFTCTLLIIYSGTIDWSILNRHSRPYAWHVLLLEELSLVNRSQSNFLEVGVIGWNVILIRWRCLKFILNHVSCFWIHINRKPSPSSNAKRRHVPHACNHRTPSCEGRELVLARTYVSLVSFQRPHQVLHRCATTKGLFLKFLVQVFILGLSCWPPESWRWCRVEFAETKSTRWGRDFLFLH